MLVEEDNNITCPRCASEDTDTISGKNGYYCFRCRDVWVDEE